MTAERWAKIRTLVESALSLPADDRAAYLAANESDPELRAEAEQLLGFEAQADQLFSTRPRPWSIEAPLEAPSLAGLVLGNYRLLEELGRGGMGAVYMAERADGAYQHRVALKILQEGIFTPRLVERFEAERQILARLQHPGIARLLDGGVTPDGRPYLVLEYVDGIPIDRFCDEHKLDTAARLRLFLKVAEAVQSAHQQLVLHLDLKPANILVTEAGEPRLLDFGISRVISETQEPDSHTEATLRLLTPRYASPEQAEGKPLGVGSDVFSLATLLYRLLTGRLPYAIGGASPLEAARMIREEQPLLPSKAAPAEVAPDLCGDLDTILLQAMRKEPSRRYATVQAFAEDIERHLASKPVQAHPDSFRYRARKFARRNRGYLIAAAAVLLVVAASVAAVIRAAVVARRADAIAERRLHDERELAHSYIFDLDDMLKELPGSVPIRVFILQHALKYLDTISQENINDTIVARDVGNGYMKVAQVQADHAAPSMDDRVGAWKSMNRAYEIQKRLFDRNPADLAQRGTLLRTVRLMGFLATDDGDVARADTFELQAWEIAQPIIADGPNNARYQTVLAVAWDLANDRGGNGGSWNFGDPVAALPWLDRMHALTVRYQPGHEKDADGHFARELLSRAMILHQLDRDAEARPLFEQALQFARASAGKDLIETEALLVTRYNYADFLINVGDLKAAEAIAPALPAAIKLTDSNRSEVSQRSDILGQQARLHLRQGKVAQGTHEMQESIDTFEQLYKLDAYDANSTGELAATCLDLGNEEKLAPALRRHLYQRTIETITPFEQRHPEVFSATLMLAQAKVGLARMDKAAHDPAGQQSHAASAAADLKRMLAAHPVQPEASKWLAQANSLLQ